MKINKILCFSILSLLICFTKQKQHSNKSVCNISPKSKIDCGFVGLNKKKCEEKGCCFIKSTDGSPWCYKGVNLEKEEKEKEEKEEKEKEEKEVKKTENESNYSINSNPDQSSYVVRVPNQRPSLERTTTKTKSSTLKY